MEESGYNRCTAPATTCFLMVLFEDLKKYDLNRTDRIGQSWAWAGTKRYGMHCVLHRGGKLTDCQMRRALGVEIRRIELFGRFRGSRTTVDGGVFALRFGGAGWSKKRRVTSFVADDGTFVSKLRRKSYRRYLANRQDNEKKKDPLLLCSPMSCHSSWWLQCRRCVTFPDYRLSQPHWHRVTD